MKFKEKIKVQIQDPEQEDIIEKHIDCAQIVYLQDNIEILSVKCKKNKNEQKRLSVFSLRDIDVDIHK